MSIHRLQKGCCSNDAFPIRFVCQEAHHVERPEGSLKHSWYHLGCAPVFTCTIFQVFLLFRLFCQTSTSTAET